MPFSLLAIAHIIDTTQSHQSQVIHTPAASVRHHHNDDDDTINTSHTHKHSNKHPHKLKKGTMSSTGGSTVVHDTTLSLASMLSNNSHMNGDADSGNKVHDVKHMTLAQRLASESKSQQRQHQHAQHAHSMQQRRNEQDNSDLVSEYADRIASREKLRSHQKRPSKFQKKSSSKKKTR